MAMRRRREEEKVRFGSRRHIELVREEAGRTAERAANRQIAEINRARSAAIGQAYGAATWRMIQDVSSAPDWLPQMHAGIVTQVSPSQMPFFDGVMREMSGLMQYLETGRERRSRAGMQWVTSYDQARARIARQAAGRVQAARGRAKDVAQAMARANTKAIADVTLANITGEHRVRMAAGHTDTSRAQARLAELIGALPMDMRKGPVAEYFNVVAGGVAAVEKKNGLRAKDAMQVLDTQATYAIEHEDTERLSQVLRQKRALWSSAKNLSQEDRSTLFAGVNATHRALVRTRKSVDDKALKAEREAKAGQMHRGIAALEAKAALAKDNGDVEAMQEIANQLPAFHALVPHLHGEADKTRASKALHQLSTANYKAISGLSKDAYAAGVVKDRMAFGIAVNEAVERGRHGEARALWEKRAKYVSGIDTNMVSPAFYRDQIANLEATAEAITDSEVDAEEKMGREAIAEDHAKIIMGFRNLEVSNREAMNAADWSIDGASDVVEKAHGLFQDALSSNLSPEQLAGVHKTYTAFMETVNEESARRAEYDATVALEDRFTAAFEELQDKPPGEGAQAAEAIVELFSGIDADTMREVAASAGVDVEKVVEMRDQARDTQQARVESALRIQDEQNLVSYQAALDARIRSDASMPPADGVSTLAESMKFRDEQREQLLGMLSDQQKSDPTFMARLAKMDEAFSSDAQAAEAASINARNVSQGYALVSRLHPNVKNVDGAVAAYEQAKSVYDAMEVEPNDRRELLSNAAKVLIGEGIEQEISSFVVSSATDDYGRHLPGYVDLVRGKAGEIVSKATQLGVDVGDVPKLIQAGIDAGKKVAADTKRAQTERVNNDFNAMHASVDAGEADPDSVRSFLEREDVQALAPRDKQSSLVRHVERVYDLDLKRAGVSQMTGSVVPGTKMEDDWNEVAQADYGEGLAANDAGAWSAVVAESNRLDSVPDVLSKAISDGLHSSTPDRMGIAAGAVSQLEDTLRQSVLSQGENDRAFAQVQFLDTLPESLRGEALTTAARANTDPAFAQRLADTRQAWSKSQYSTLATKEGVTDYEIYSDLFDGKIASRDFPLVKRQVELLATNLMAVHGVGSVGDAAKSAAAAIEGTMGTTQVGARGSLTMYPIETSVPADARSVFQGNADWIQTVLAARFDTDSFELQATGRAREAVARNRYPSYNVFERSEDGVMRILSEGEPFNLRPYAEVLKPLSDELNELAIDIERNEGLMSQYSLGSRLMGMVRLDKDTPSLAESETQKERLGRMISNQRQQALLLVNGADLSGLPGFDTEDKRRRLREVMLGSWEALRGLVIGAGPGTGGPSP